MPEGTTTTGSSLELPLPVTANDAVTCLNGQINVERSIAPALIALSAGLVAVSSNQPRAELLFIGAGTVTIGLYFIAPFGDSDNAHPIMSTFLRRVPNVFTALGCILIVLGIGNAFPNEIALIPLFLFVSFAALAALFGMKLGVWPTATLYGAALVSLMIFVIFAFMA